MPYHNMSPKTKAKGKKRKAPKKSMKGYSKYSDMYDTGSTDKYGNPKGSS